jgi:hypothetical protein
MALVEKISEEELILYNILINPILATEFMANFDKLPREEKFEWDVYQKEILCDFSMYISICCARSVGKTECLSWQFIWLMIFNMFPQDYVLYTVPAKANLEPVFNRIVRFLRTNSFLKQFISPNSGVNNSDFTIKLLNNSSLMCRIAGQSGTGINVIGLHCPFEVVDESGYYNWPVWLELQPTFNTFTSGCRMTVSGVPDGRREKSVCYEADQVNSDFVKHRVSALDNPRFSEEDHRKAIEQYGGKDSDDYIHFVLGQHGKPVFALFDRALMEVQDYPVYKLLLDGVNLSENIADYIEKIKLFPNLDRNSRCIMGVDLGYTEPTAIIIEYLDRNDCIKFHGRIQLNKVSYPIQERLIDLLDTKFEPLIIGVDEGSAGKSVRQHLLEDKDYMHKEYSKRLISIDFSSSTVIGQEADGTELKMKTKPYATTVLQTYSNDHKIIYSYKDVELITELERMVYSKTLSGEIVYRTLTIKGGKKGEDHFTSALLCSTLAYHLFSEVLNRRPAHVKLAQPRWY